MMWAAVALKDLSGDEGSAAKARANTFELWFGQAKFPASVASRPFVWHSFCNSSGNRGVRCGMSRFGTVCEWGASRVAEHDDLSGALRKARLAEAAHFEAVLGIRDSKSLRLQVLKDDLAPSLRRPRKRRML